MGVFLLGFVSSGVARKGFSLLTKRSWKSRVPIALDLTSERTINEGWKLEIQTVSSSYFKYKNTTRHSYSMTSNSSSCARQERMPFGALRHPGYSYGMPRLLEAHGRQHNIHPDSKHAKMLHNMYRHSQVSLRIGKVAVWLSVSLLFGRAKINIQWAPFGKGDCNSCSTNAS